MTNKMPVSLELVGRRLSPHHWSWSPRDVMLYALGVGARPDTDLDFVYEQRGPAVLPTFAVIPSTLASHVDGGALDIDFRNLLHGEQGLRVHRPLPPQAEVETSVRITDVWDKGKAAIVVWEFVTADGDGPLFTATSSSFIHGAGGFGGERGPRGTSFSVPDRAADVELREQISHRAAAIYRLSGDYNPIHIDPEFARSAGYDRPFLHGLCTYGHLGRMLVQQLCDGDASAITRFDVRFLDVVYPGEELLLRLWKDDGTHALEVSTSRGAVLAGSIDIAADRSAE